MKPPGKTTFFKKKKANARKKSVLPSFGSIYYQGKYIGLSARMCWKDIFAGLLKCLTFSPSDEIDSPPPTKKN